MALLESSLTQIERRVRDAARRHRMRLASAERAESERDEAIRAAHAAGVGPSRLAELTGLSKPRIDQIRRRARL